MSLLDPPRVPADDRGFLLGDGLFETVRLYRGRPFRLDAHLDRLRAGAARLGIPVPGDLEERLDRALADLGEGEGALRITLSRGPGPGLGPPASPVPTLAVQIRPWAPDPGWYREGITARVVGRVAEGALTAGLKALGYLENVQALREARETGADEALLTDSRGRVVEGAASNLVALAEGRVLAPGPESGALPGITRGIVLELLRAEGREVEERAVSRTELSEAEEVLLTSSLREVVPVVRVDGRRVGAGRPGGLFRGVSEGLRRTVDGELDVGGD